MFLKGNAIVVSHGRSVKYSFRSIKHSSWLRMNNSIRNNKEFLYEKGITFIEKEFNLIIMCFILGTSTSLWTLWPNITCHNTF